MIKLIATDLDGTLMAPDHMTVTDRTKKALLDAHNNGIKIAIATGRTYSITTSVTDQLPFVDYVIYSNGAGVYDRCKGKTIYTNCMPWKIADKIFEYLDRYPVFYEVYCDGHSNMRADKEKYFALKNIPQKFIDELMQSIVPHNDLREGLKGKEIEKINIFHLDEGMEHVVDFINAQPEIVPTNSIADDIEMTGVGADKGRALESLCGFLQIHSNEVMSFGDAGNDCTMLKFADYSYAMENGSDDAKSVAKEITASNANDGVAIMVEKIALVNENEQ